MYLLEEIWCFIWYYLSRPIQKCTEAQHNHYIAIITWSSITVKTCFALPIYMYMLTIMTLGIPNQWESIHRFMPTLECCFPHNLFYYSVFIFCVGLSHVYIFPMVVWLDREDFHTFFFFFWINSGKAIYRIRIIISTHMIETSSIYLKQWSSGHPLVLFVLR